MKVKIKMPRAKKLYAVVSSASGGVVTAGYVGSNFGQKAMGF